MKFKVFPGVLFPGQFFYSGINHLVIVRTPVGEWVVLVLFGAGIAPRTQRLDANLEGLEGLLSGLGIINTEDCLRSLGELDNHQVDALKGGAVETRK